MEGASFESYRNTIFPVEEDLHDANKGKRWKDNREKKAQHTPQNAFSLSD